MRPFAKLKLCSLALLLADAGCMQPEYPDDFEEQVQTTTLADAAGVGAPGSLLPLPQSDGGTSINPEQPWGPPEAGVATPEAGSPVPSDAGSGLNPARDASTARDAGALPEAAVAADAAASSDTGPAPNGGELTSCSISASTDASDTLFYAGKYGCAVWIANSSNKVVKAFFVATRIANRSGLPTYKSQSSGVSVDVVAGATLGSAKQHQYTWTLQDGSGARVPPGKYTLNVETHSSNGVNLATVPFDTTQSPVSAKGANGQVRSASITCN